MEFLTIGKGFLSNCFKIFFSKIISLIEISYHFSVFNIPPIYIFSKHTHVTTSIHHILSFQHTMSVTLYINFVFLVVDLLRPLPCDHRIIFCCFVVDSPLQLAVEAARARRRRLRFGGNSEQLRRLGL